LSSTDLQEGATYTLYTGGRSTGAATDGLYSGGEYTPGNAIVTVTMADIVTGAGSPMGGRGGFGGGPRRR